MNQQIIKINKFLFTWGLIILSTFQLYAQPGEKIVSGISNEIRY